MNKEQAAYKEGFISVLANIGLFGIKLWAGIASSSLALTADAWHTLSDSLSSLIVIVGTKLSNRKPDKEHPFGHGRWEQIASIFIAFLLALIAWDFLKESISQFRSGEEANFGTIAIIVTLVSIIAKEGLAQYAFYIARKTGNSSVKADGWHHRTDALSSVVVLVGILLKEQFWWIDSILGLVISLLLFYAVYEILKDSINTLLGERPDPEFIDKVKDIVKMKSESDLFPHHFHLHKYGDHKELTFHVKMPGDTSIDEAHKITRSIEKGVREKLGVEATLYIDPLK